MTQSVDFLGIGVQKGGTTWLYRHLSRHPQVAFPRGKESHYWDGRDHPSADEWIRWLEPESRISADGRPVRTGEITPAYATLPEGSLQAIRGRCPGIRLFVALRNPIERAWSAALMGLARCGMELSEASDGWFLDVFRSSDARRKGDQATCLERWWSVFPREQLLVLLNEDLHTRPADVLASLARHLRIEESDFARLSAEEIGTRVVPGLWSAGSQSFASTVSPPLRPTLFEALLAIHRKDIERLERCLGRDLSRWYEPPAR